MDIAYAQINPLTHKKHVLTAKWILLTVELNPLHMKNISLQLNNAPYMCFVTPYR